MAPEPAQQVAAGDDGSESELSDVASIADDESFGYGEGDADAEAVAEADAHEVNGQGQESAPQDAAQETDDYARTFDSPAAAEKEQLAEVEEEEDQQPVSNAPESMNISQQPDQPDAVPNQPVPVDPLSAPSPAEQGSQPMQPTTSNGVVAPQPIENGMEPLSAAPGALPDPTSITTTTIAASPNQQTATSPQLAKLEADAKPAAPAPNKQDVDVQPKSEDVEMTTEGASDATPIDIQKLVDQITAKAEATSDQPAAINPPLPAQNTSQAMDVDMSSLPPKPALTQEQSKQTYSPASYHHASLPNTSGFPASAGVPSQLPYATSGAPGTSQSPNQSVTPSFASYPNAFPPGTAPQQAPGQSEHGLQQTYDEFLADERRHMAEAKWERFPEGSRIFIGASPFQ